MQTSAQTRAQILNEIMGTAEKAGLTQEDVASLLEVSIRTFQRMLHGDQKRPIRWVELAGLRAALADPANLANRFPRRRAKQTAAP